METIKVRATLKPAGISDIFHGRDTYTNKLLFVRCLEKGCFIGAYKVPEIDNHDYPFYTTYKELDKIKDGNDYYRKELYEGISAHIFYTLSDAHNDFDFQFKLIIRTGDWFDFFEAENHVKPNVVYYVKVNSDQLTGPHAMSSNADPKYVKSAIEKGQLLVPSANQTFEPYKIAHAS